MFIMDNKLECLCACPTCGEKQINIKTESACCNLEVCVKCMYMEYSCGNVDRDESRDYFRINKTQLESLLKYKE